MVTNTDYMNMYPYTGVGSTYEISFDYDVTSSVWVYWLSPTGSLSDRKVEDVDYSISNESGVIILKVLIDFGVDGHILILRKMPYTQTWQGIDGTTPSPAGIMAALDRIVWQMQQVQGQSEGALHIPMYERMDMEIPALDARKGKIAGYDENGFPNVVGSFAIVPVSEYVKPGLTKETEEDFHEYFNLASYDDVDDKRSGSFVVDSNGWFTICQSNTDVYFDLEIICHYSYGRNERLLLKCAFDNTGVYGNNVTPVFHKTNMDIEGGGEHCATGGIIDSVLYGPSDNSAGFAIALNIAMYSSPATTKIFVRATNIRNDENEPVSNFFRVGPFAPVAEDFSGNPITTVFQLYGSSLGERIYTNKNVNALTTTGGPSVGTLYRDLTFNADATVQGIYTILGDLVIEPGVTLTVNNSGTGYQGPNICSVARAGAGGSDGTGVQKEGGSGSYKLFTAAADGASSGNDLGGAGGAGSGFVIFNVFGNFINNGSIVGTGGAGGEGAQNLQAAGGGGGGGGALVVIRALGESSKNIIGSITLNGGAGGKGGETSNDGNMDAEGGCGGGGGAGGTVELYVYDSPDTSGISVSGGAGGAGGGGYGDNNADPGDPGGTGVIYLVNYASQPEIISRPFIISADNDARYYAGKVAQYMGGWKVD